MLRPFSTLLMPGLPSTTSMKPEPTVVAKIGVPSASCRLGLDRLPVGARDAGEGDDRSDVLAGAFAFSAAGFSTGRVGDGAHRQRGRCDPPARWASRRRRDRRAARLVLGPGATHRARNPAATASPSIATSAVRTDRIHRHAFGSSAQRLPAPYRRSQDCVPRHSASCWYRPSPLRRFGRALCSSVAIVRCSLVLVAGCAAQAGEPPASRFPRRETLQPLSTPLDVRKFDVVNGEAGSRRVPQAVAPADRRHTSTARRPAADHPRHRRADRGRGAASRSTRAAMSWSPACSVSQDLRRPAGRARAARRRRPPQYEVLPMADWVHGPHQAPPATAARGPIAPVDARGAQRLNLRRMSSNRPTRLRDHRCSPSSALAMLLARGTAARRRSRPTRCGSATTRQTKGAGVEEWARKMNSDDPLERLEGVSRSLSESTDPAAVPYLVQALGDGDMRVKAKAIDACGTCAPPTRRRCWCRCSSCAAPSPR